MTPEWNNQNLKLKCLPTSSICVLRCQIWLPCWKEEKGGDFFCDRMLSWYHCCFSIWPIGCLLICPHSWAHVSFLRVSLASPFHMHLQQTFRGRIKFIFPSVSLLRESTRANEVHENYLSCSFNPTFLCMSWNSKGLNRRYKGKFLVNCSFLFKCPCTVSLPLS